jgi:hypothetical protein
VAGVLVLFLERRRGFAGASVDGDELLLAMTTLIGCEFRQGKGTSVSSRER